MSSSAARSPTCSSYALRYAMAASGLLSGFPTRRRSFAYLEILPFRRACGDGIRLRLASSG